jgi:hypothetical protein
VVSSFSAIELAPIRFGGQAAPGWVKTPWRGRSFPGEERIHARPLFLSLPVQGLAAPREPEKAPSSLSPPRAWPD